MDRSRSVRIFLSSTFRDFGEERDLLVRKVFPALRARLKDRFVELVDVDLRWGITVEEAERGEVLPICLAEIDRSRPYFIGMLGERYGWIPPHEGYALDLLERQPWLKKHQGGKSVTELEILHGVLKNKRMKSRAFFYFRSPAYARSKGGHYVPDSTEDRQRQLDLKRRIKDSGYSVTGYRDPEALATRMEWDLWRLLDAEFPAADVPDAFERESMRHQAYAAPRRRLYLGSERYQAVLGQAVEFGEQRILIEGASGGGKSALIANFFEGYRKRHPKHHIHEHYLGASADAGDPHALVRRLCEFIKRHTNSSEEISSDPQNLMDGLPLWLATASSWARKRRTRFIFVWDSLNSLIDQQDLRWWPAFLPQGITIVVSCLPGPVHDALMSKTEVLPGQDKPPKWKIVKVRPLTKAQSSMLLNTYLARFNKKLSLPMVIQVQAHPLSTNPLFVRTLAEELRLFGVHEELSKRLSYYLKSETVDDLFEKVIERVEGDCGKKAVKATLTAIWASRAGLTEKEILGITDLKPAIWAPIRNAVDEFLLESGGKISFAHDYVRIAVSDRYLPSADSQQRIHRQVGTWFKTQQPDMRRVEEEPWQWQQAMAWNRLQKCLTEETVIQRLLDVNEGLDLLKYWLCIPGMRYDLLEVIYRKAWRGWGSLTSWGEISRFAFRLCEFLRSTGASGEFVFILARLVLQLDRNASGDTPLHGPALSLLGILSLEQGDLKAARKYLEAALKMSETSLLDPAESIRRQYNMAKVLLAEENLEEGAELLVAVVRNASTVFGAASPERLPFLHALANFHVDHGDMSEAWRLTQEAFALEKRLYGTGDVRLSTSLNALGWLYLKEDKTDLAVSYFQQCISNLTKTYGAEHAFLELPLANTALTLMNAERYEEALPSANKSVRLALIRYGPISDEVASRQGVLATILQRARRYSEAEECFQEAVQTARARCVQLERSGSLALSTALSNLGLFLFECGRSAEAQEPLRQALQMQEQISGRRSRS
jgi:nephrocystin-3